MVENGHKPQPSTVEKGASGISGGISFGGGRQGGYEVLLDGSPPPSVGELPSAQTIFERDYRVGTNIGSPSSLTAFQLKRAAAYNAELPEGATGVMISPYKSEVRFSPKRT